MIYKSKSLIVAESVLLQLTGILNGPDTLPRYREVGHVLQECYQNNREQGFLVWPLFANYTAFYVAQARRSDDIVVYQGRYSPIGLPEEAYKNSIYFGKTAFEEAASWIAEELVKLVRSSPGSKLAPI